ncbi:MAG: endonuclease [Xanthomonadales bacterium]|nr:endonuclease [Xanthomonadales bacterium]
MNSLILLALALGGACADPDSYYAGLNVSSPETARTSLHSLIEGHTRLPYTSATQLDVWTVLEITDEDPTDATRIIDVYRNQSLLKIDRDYQREHSWPASYGFPNDVSTNYPYTDLHHLHLADGSYNASRGNLPFDWCASVCDERPTEVTNGIGGGTGAYPGNSNWRASDRWEVWKERRGDIARGLLYMDVRYEGGSHPVTGVAEPDLILTNERSLIVTSGGSNAAVAYMGMLSVLIEWHELDPPDLRDQARNEGACAAQGNRNPSSTILSLWSAFLRAAVGRRSLRQASSTTLAKNERAVVSLSRRPQLALKVEWFHTASSMPRPTTQRYSRL